MKIALLVASPHFLQQPHKMVSLVFLLLSMGAVYEQVKLRAIGGQFPLQEQREVPEGCPILNSQIYIYNLRVIVKWTKVNITSLMAIYVFHESHKLLKSLTVNFLDSQGFHNRFERWQRPAISKLLTWVVEYKAETHFITSWQSLNCSFKTISLVGNSDIDFLV